MRFILCAITLLLATIPARATIVYSNTTTDAQDSIPYAANGYTQVGDQITLGGTDRAATSATVQLFSDGSAGTFDATLRFFDIASPVGAQIGSDIVVTGIAAPGGVNGDEVNVNFAIPNLTVPDSFIFTVSVGNFSSGVDILGLDLFEPPTVGSSDNTFAIAYNGTQFVTTTTNSENAFFELDAESGVTPEPATGGLIAVAAAVLIALRRRRV